MLNRHLNHLSLVWNSAFRTTWLWRVQLLQIHSQIILGYFHSLFNSISDLSIRLNTLEWAIQTTNQKAKNATHILWNPCNVSPTLQSLPNGCIYQYISTNIFEKNKKTTKEKKNPYPMTFLQWHLRISIVTSSKWWDYVDLRTTLWEPLLEKTESRQTSLPTLLFSF